MAVEVGSLLEFLRQITLGPVEHADIDSIALLSPMLGSARFYTQRETSQRTVSNALSSAEPCDRDVLVRSLYKIARKLNGRLVDSMGSQTASERKFAHTAMQQVSRMGMNQDWLHGVMQVLLLDRVLYAISGFPVVASYSRSSSTRSQVPEGFEKVFSSLNSWPEVMDQFCQLWESAYDSSNGDVLFPGISVIENQGEARRADSISKEVSPDGIVEERSHFETPSGSADRVLEKLVRSVRNSWQSVRVNTVFNNFCFAAMGLRALMLRGNLYPLDLEKPWWRCIREDKLGNLLLECRDVERFISINEDYSILRSLYMMVSVSPIVLLNGNSFTKSGHVRYPLHGIVQACCVNSAPLDEQRLFLERRLFELVVEMALTGPSVFESSIAKVIAYWRSVRETSGMPLRALVEPVSDEDSNDGPNNPMVISRRESAVTDDQIKRDSITRQLRNVLNASGDVKLGHAVAVSRLVLIRRPCGEEESSRRICVAQRVRDGPMTELEVETIIADLEDERDRERDRLELDKLLEEQEAGRAAMAQSVVGLRAMSDAGSGIASPNGIAGRTRGSSSIGMTTSNTRDDPCTGEYSGQKSGSGAGRSSPPKVSRFGRGYSPNVTLGRRRRVDSEEMLKRGRTRSRKKTKTKTKTKATADFGGSDAQFSFEEKIDRIRDTFGNAFKLKHAWSSTQTLRYNSALCSDRLLMPYILDGNEAIAWRTVEFVIPSFDTEDFMARTLIRSGLGLHEPIRYQTTEVFTRKQWDQLDDGQRREIFRNKNILVKGGDAPSIEHIRFCRISELSKIVDTYAQLQARDCTEIPRNVANEDTSKFSSLRMVRSSIREFFRSVKEFRQKSTDLGWDFSYDGVRSLAFERLPSMQTNFRVLNFLDIPVADDIFPVPLDDFSQYLVRNSFMVPKVEDEVVTFLTDCSPKDAGKRWMLISAMSAWSNWHIDAAGLGTVICMADGLKLWIVPHNPDLLPGAFSKDLEDSQSDHTDHIWLERGDMFYMRPATSHMVVTLKDSIVFGGHFYTYELVKQTLRGLLLEHYFGRDVTNTEHLKVTVLLMKAVCSLASRYAETGLEDYENDLSIKDEDLAYLLVVVTHLDQLVPELPEDMEATLWQETDDFAHDFGLVKIAVREVILRQPPDFVKGLDSAESFLDKECHTYEGRLLDEEPDVDHSAKAIKVVCLCGGHVARGRGKVSAGWVPFEV